MFSYWLLLISQNFCFNQDSKWWTLQIYSKYKNKDVNLKLTVFLFPLVKGKTNPAKTALNCTKAPLPPHFMLVCFMNYLPVYSTNVNHPLLNCQYVTVKHTYAADRLAHHLLQGESVERAAVAVISVLWSGGASRPGMHKFHYLSLILNPAALQRRVVTGSASKGPSCSLLLVTVSCRP